MRIKKKSKSKRIKEAAIKDAAGELSSLTGYILGLSKIPIPLEILKEIIAIIKEESPPHFVDWKLEDWPGIYHQELEKCVKLPYKGKEYFLPEVLIFDNIKKRLNLSNVHFHRMETPFSLPDNIRALTESSFEKLLKYLQKKRRYSNEQNLRLVNIIEKEMEIELEVQSVKYRDFVHTNLLLDAKSKEKDQTLRDYLHSSGKIEGLNNSPLANHLGINILLFTADGSLIMQKRSGKVAFRTKELCSAASGAVSITDVVPKITLEEMPKLRKGFEEIGIFKGDVPKGQIFFLGITRELIRGGKPEMFFFGKTDLSERQIKKRWGNARDKWESKDLVFFHFGKVAYDDLTQNYRIHEFLSKVDNFIDKYVERSSIPLLTNLALWIKYRLEQKGE